MLSRRGFVSCAICTAVGFAAIAEDAGAQTPGVTRTVLQKTEYPGEKYVSILMVAEFDANLKVARHTHPGLESTYLVAGGGTLSVKGQPDRVMAAGEGFQVPAEVPHSFQVGPEKVRLAITYVVEKDKPLASPAPE
ncbi:cupin domain-containing protein [Azorhizobium doebereinerae]|uniref:cupin domain-containing protein n=1 Tax=Azorhizobium doebereinerae TaxID=281091 RepID=UPI0004915A26|nr:cupin domain-containing protein [Azorhizobium doebereinerae]